jgi:hypothetical protein
VIVPLVVVSSDIVVTSHQLFGFYHSSVGKHDSAVHHQQPLLISSPTLVYFQIYLIPLTKVMMKMKIKFDRYEPWKPYGILYFFPFLAEEFFHLYSHKIICAI